MNAIRTVVKMYTRGKLIWFFLPWMGLLLQFFAALIVILIINLLFGGKTPFYPGGPCSSLSRSFSSSSPVLRCSRSHLS
jgi:hypothetical protein